MCLQKKTKLTLEANIFYSILTGESLAKIGKLCARKS